MGKCKYCHHRQITYFLWKDKRKRVVLGNWRNYKNYSFGVDFTRVFACYALTNIDLVFATYSILSPQRD